MTFASSSTGKPLSVRELKAGMKGTATITTRTTVTPVTVTEVKNGTVVHALWFGPSSCEPTRESRVSRKGKWTSAA